MATATKESRAASQLARHALNVLRAGLDAVGMFEDNGGACRWMLSPAMDRSSHGRRASPPATTWSVPRVASVTGRPRRASIAGLASSRRSILAPAAMDQATTWTPNVGWMKVAASAARR
jgi:hypothetical protein